METTQEYLKRLLPLLKKPIPHSWRVQSYSKNKPQATVMAYIDSRDAQNVLDTYCSYGWHRKHQMLNDRLYCSVGIEMPNGSIMWREDCGTESNEDKEKGQASDSFKRACVNWGIGRFLYDMDIKYVDASAKKEQGSYPYPIDEQGKRIWDMTAYINGKNPNAPTAPSNQLTPPATTTPKEEVKLPWLNKKDTENWDKVVAAMKGGFTIAQIRKKWAVSKETEAELNEAIK